MPVLRKKKKNNKTVKFLIVTFTSLTAFILAYYVYSLLNFRLKFSVLSSVLTSVLVAVVFILFVAFHKTLRCVFLLMIPQFFGKRGRAAVLAYAIYVTFSGPVENIHHNSKVMYGSILCSEVKRRVYVALL